MDIFQYDNLWLAYIAALTVLGISGYFLTRPIPLIWLRWNLLVAILVFLAAPIQVQNAWMVPSSLYFLFEYFFVGNLEAIGVLYQLLTHVAVAVVATSLMLYGIKLMNRPSA